MNANQIERPIGFSPQEISSLINEEVLYQHATEAAFLWTIRNSATFQPNYKLKDLADLDERVEANIDGLRVAGEAGWKYSKELMDQDEPGAIFSTAVLALEGQDARRIDVVYEKVESDTELAGELIAAFGWVDSKNLQGKVIGLLNSASPFWRCMGISACVAHRVNPNEYLRTELISNDPMLRARAFRAVGELGLKEFASQLKGALQLNDETCSFWAAWSSVLTGELNYPLPILQKIAISESSFNNKALDIALRVMGSRDSYEWLKELAKTNNGIRHAIEGTAAVGDPIFIPWLIKQMEVPELSRVAGESFSSITGVDIDYEGLDGEQPGGVDVGPNDNPEDENVSMDQDEDLPYPDSNLVQRWWDKHRQQFTNGQRYLMGKNINEKSLKNVLLEGNQRQRTAAAIELVLLKPGVPLFETRAPAKRQQKQLESWTS